jgi:hypothetical protein
MGACAIHGEQTSWAGVCRVVGDAFADDRRVEFVWGTDDGFLWALCPDCDEAALASRKKPHDLVPMCNACFERGVALNGSPEPVQ